MGAWTLSFIKYISAFSILVNAFAITFQGIVSASCWLCQKGGSTCRSEVEVNKVPRLRFPFLVL